MPLFTAPQYYFYNTGCGSNCHGTNNNVVYTSGTGSYTATGAYTSVAGGNGVTFTSSDRRDSATSGVGPTYVVSSKSSAVRTSGAGTGGGEGL